MYKINEAAAMLGVDKIIIYEKLIHNSSDLEAHTQKKNGITFIQDEGIELLRHLIYKNEKHFHREKMLGSGTPDKETEDNISGLGHRPQWIIDKSEIDKRVKMFSPPGENLSMAAEDPRQKVGGITPQPVHFKKNSIDTDVDLETVAQTSNRTAVGFIDISSTTTKQGTDFGQAVAEIKGILAEKAALKMTIAELRSGMIALDSEIKRKDDAIVGYHKLMKEDLEWLWDVESKLLRHLSHES